MRSGVAVFRSDHELYHADTCEPLKRAVEQGETQLRAFARGAYPASVPLPDGVLREVRSVGYWDAPHDQAWGLDWHRNEGIEITYVSKGNVAFAVEQQEYELRAGDITITRPWQLHRVGDPDITACTLHWLILDVGVRRPNQEWRWPSWLGLSERDLGDLTVLLSRNEQPVWPGNGEVGGCFERLGELLRQGRPEESESRVRLLIGELFVALTELLRRAEPELDSSLTSTERTVRMFLSSLERRLDEPWTLDAMARACGLGRSRFSHYCQQITNSTPAEYLSYLRIRRAQELLSSRPELSVTEVALDCGFGTSQYFATAFRKHTGNSPTEYRLVTNGARPER